MIPGVQLGGGFPEKNLLALSQPPPQLQGSNPNTWGELLNLINFVFLICKMGIKLPPLQNACCTRDNVSKPQSTAFNPQKTLRCHSGTC